MILKEESSSNVWKRNSYSNSSRGTTTQTIVNDIPEQCKAEVMEKDSEMDSDRESIHSNWSESIPINNEINIIGDAMKTDTQQRKRAVKNIVLVPYKPKPKDWGTWKIKSPYATSMIASPPLDPNQTQNQSQNKEEMSYVPHSHYYEPAHPPAFYEDE